MKKVRKLMDDDNVNAKTFSFSHLSFIRLSNQQTGLPTPVIKGKAAIIIYLGNNTELPQNNKT